MGRPRLGKVAMLSVVALLVGLPLHGWAAEAKTGDSAVAKLIAQPLTLKNIDALTRFVKEGSKNERLEAADAVVAKHEDIERHLLMFDIWQDNYAARERVLGQIWQKAIVQALVECADSGDPILEKVGIRTLLRLTRDVGFIFEPVLETCGTGRDLTIDYKSDRELEKLLPSHRSQFVKLTHDKDPQVVFGALGCLLSANVDDDREFLDRSFTGDLLKLTERPEPLFRAVGVWYLANMAGIDAIQVLIPLFSDPDPGVRRCLVFSLDAFDGDGRGTAAKTLLRRFDSLPPSARETALRILESQYDGGETETELEWERLLMRALDDRNPAVRSLAYLLCLDRKLVKRPSPSAILDRVRQSEYALVTYLDRCRFDGSFSAKEMAPFLRHENAEIVSAAIGAVSPDQLGEIKGSIKEFLSRSTSEDGRASVFRALSKNGKLSREMAKTMQKDTDPSMRLAALEIWDWLSMEEEKDDPAGLESYLEALSDGDEKVRSRAISGLPAPSYAFELETATKDPSPDVRHAAVARLAASGGVLAKGALGRLAKSEDEQVREMAKAALQYLERRDSGG